MRAETRQPFRALGFGNNLFPGYTSVLGIEGPHGADAVVNPYFRELLKALPVELVEGWRLIVQPELIAKLHRVYDLLNVKYYLASPIGVPKDYPGLRFVGDFDLDVYTSDSVWPRAFFTDTLVVYDTAKELVDLLHTGDGQPFAAMRKTDVQDNSSLAQLVDDAIPRRVVAARDYHLTNNTTRFTIDAPQAGVVVLSEAYLAKDFGVTVNGQAVPYFRVNHAFKGIWVDKTGTYTITYSYWPRYLTLCLWGSTAGAIGAAVWLGRAWRTYRRGQGACDPARI
jgi:hypothetical protein